MSRSGEDLYQDAELHKRDDEGQGKGGRCYLEINLFNSKQHGEIDVVMVIVVVVVVVILVSILVVVVVGAVILVVVVVMMVIVVKVFMMVVEVGVMVVVVNDPVMINYLIYYLVSKYSRHSCVKKFTSKLWDFDLKSTV